MKIGNRGVGKRLLLIGCVALVSACGKGKSAGQSGKDDATTLRWKVERVGKVGFIDRKGSLVVGLTYDKGRHFRDGLAAVAIGETWGFIDEVGKLVINPQYDDVLMGFSEGLACVAKNEKWGFIDKAGKWVVEARFDLCGDFAEGFGAVLEGELWGFVNKSGEVVIKPKFKNGFPGDDQGFFADGFATASVDGALWGLIDKGGAFAIEPKFEDAKVFIEGLAAAKLDGKWGYIGKNGEFAIAPQFDFARSFHDGLAPVEISRKWGFIDTSGKFVLNPTYDGASNAFGVLEVVDTSVRRRVSIIDRTGKVLVDDVLGFSQAGLHEKDFDGTYGWVDGAGNVVWDGKDTPP